MFNKKNILYGVILLSVFMINVHSFDIDVIKEQTNWKVDLERIDLTNYPDISVFTTIYDPQGATVKNLKDENFKLHVMTEIIPLNVERFEMPLSICFIVDKSGSMKEKTIELKKAASRFIELIMPSDRMMIIFFDRYAKIIQDFSSDKAELIKNISHFYAKGATALYDAMYMGIKETKNEDNDNKKVLIVLTDGKDQISDDLKKQCSAHNKNDVIEYANANSIPIHTIGLGEDADHEVLKHISSSTNGQYYYAPNKDALLELYEKIAENLKVYYKANYVCPFNATAVKERKLFLEVDEQRNSGLGRSGYLYADTDVAKIIPKKIEPTLFDGDSSVRIIAKDNYGNPIAGEFQVVANGQVIKEGRIMRGNAVVDIDQVFYNKKFRKVEPKKWERDTRKKFIVPKENKLRIFTTGIKDQFEQLTVELSPVHEPNVKNIFLTTVDGCGDSPFTSTIAPGEYFIKIKDNGWLVLEDIVKIPYRNRTVKKYQFGKVLITVNGRELTDREKIAFKLKIVEKNTNKIIFDNKLYYFVGNDSSGFLAPGNYTLTITDGNKDDSIQVKGPLEFLSVCYGGEEIFADISLDDVEYFK